jgi:hypothetical protein
MAPTVAGMKDDYSKRTMGLLITDIGCIVFGASSAFAPPNYVKVRNQRVAMGLVLQM